MTFKITVARQPFAVEFETGSVSEAIGVLQAEGTEFAKLFDINFGNSGGNGAETAEASTAATPAATPAAPARRGRKPAEASAPPPLAVPSAAPPAPPAPVAPTAPVDVTATNANGIPAFLDRTAQAAPPPPPVLPVAPPVAPAAPPVAGPVGQRVIAELEKRATGAVDHGQGLADWLASAGVTIKGATFAEAISCLRMTGDEKLGGVATALQV